MVFVLRLFRWGGMAAFLAGIATSLALSPFNLPSQMKLVPLAAAFTGIVARFFGVATEQLYFRWTGTKATVSGNIVTCQNTSIAFRPIRVSGVWQIAIDSTQNIEKPTVVALNGSLAGTSIGLMTSNSSARKGQMSGKVRCTKVRIAVSLPIPPDTELEMRFTLRYDPPEIVRSFRLNKVLHGQPMDARWTVSLRGPCTVHEFPTQATIIEKSEGFLVVPIRAIPVEEPTMTDTDQIN